MTFIAWLTLRRVADEVGTLLEAGLRRSARLSLTSYEVLVTLSRLGTTGVVRMGDLARAQALPKSSLTRIVGDLEAEGLVMRHHAPDNRRTVEVELTGRGRERLAAAVPVYLAGVQRHVGRHMDRDEAATLVQVLERIHSNREDGAG